MQGVLHLCGGWRAARQHGSFTISYYVGFRQVEIIIGVVLTSSEVRSYGGVL